VVDTEVEVLELVDVREVVVDVELLVLVLLVRVILEL